MNVFQAQAQGSDSGSASWYTSWMSVSATRVHDSDLHHQMLGLGFWACSRYTWFVVRRVQHADLPCNGRGVQRLLRVDLPLTRS